jgi:hypothetical protein
MLRAMASREAAGNTPEFDPAPDLVGLDDEQLKAEIHRLMHREREISFQRRFLHGQIELARGELLRRVTQVGSTSLNADDIDELDRILGT